MTHCHGSQIKLRYVKKTMIFFHSKFEEHAAFLSRPHHFMAEDQIAITLYTKIMIIGKIIGLFLKK